MRNDLIKLLLFLLACIFSSQSLAALSEHELKQQLRADFATLQKARAQYEQFYKSGKAVDGEEADFSAWISQLSEQLMEDCRALSSVSTAPLPADLPCDQLSAKNPAPVEIDVAAESTETEKTRRMVDQFNGSLGEFDERLLREQDRIKSRAPRTESASNAGGGASGGDSTGAAGSASDDSGKSGEASQQSSAENGTGDRQETSANSEKGTPGTAGDPGTPGTPGRSVPGTKSSAPDDIPDGSDDDVIARQIREAAEKETDPELKKKLWDEYRRYRDATK